jgi:hypothetical protein
MKHVNLRLSDEEHATLAQMADADRRSLNAMVTALIMREADRQSTRPTAPTEYHDGVPVLPPTRAASVTDKLRIQIIGIRAGWSAWAAREADAARKGGGETAVENCWRDLMTADDALRAAETRLEAAIETMRRHSAD